MRQLGICTLVIAAVLIVAGCTKLRVDDPNEFAWTAARPHAVLLPTAKVKSRYHRYICPTIEETYVVRRGEFVRTFAELQPLLRPIDTVELARAYRALLRTVEIERDETLQALNETTPLEFHDGERAFYGVYVATDAARWGVPHEPLIEATATTITVTGPAYRIERLRGMQSQYPADYESRVELVRETFHRSGEYERAVVRVLERGEAARVHQPAPLL